MQFAKSLTTGLVVLFLAVTCFSQAPETSEVPPAEASHVRSSPAFAELILRKAVLEAELEELLVRYTDEFPKVLESRFEISEIDAALARIGRVPESESGKLTLALGKMLVQRASYATEVDALTRRYSEAHPEVKRAKRKLEIFDKAVKRIL